MLRKTHASGKVKQTSLYNEKRSSGLHKGADLVGLSSKTIVTPFKIKIIKAGWENPDNTKQGYGRRVWGQILEKGKYYKMYIVFGHLSSISVKTGQTIAIGKKIGIEGSTGSSSGSHLHIEIRKDLGSKSSAVDITFALGMENKYMTHTFTNNIRKGDRGLDVQLLQAALNKKGFRDNSGNKLKEDGQAGNKTKQAINKARKKYGWKQNGVAGKGTRTKLGCFPYK